MSDGNRNTAPLMFLKPRRDDKRLISKAPNHFDGLQIGASDSMSVVELVKNIGKPFFIDPMAYMFTLPPEAVTDFETHKVRASLSSLAHRYSSLLGQTIGKRAISTDDIINQVEVLDDTTRNALEYQRSKISGQLNLFSMTSYYDKYRLLDDSDDSKPVTANAVLPCVVIAPYFHFADTSSPWYTATIRCAKLASRYIQSGERLYTTLLIDPHLLDFPVQIREIITEVAALAIDGVFIWVNGMDEESAPVSRLANLLFLISELKAKGKSVIKMHGGYFSVLMNSYGLDGFSCNLSYRTSRNIMSYRWKAPKVPRSKFYVPQLHCAYDIEEAAHILKMFPFTRCRCAVCRDAYGNDFDKMQQSMKEKGFCESHFLNARKQELNFARSGRKDAIAALDTTISLLGQHNINGARHIGKWRKALSDFNALTR